MSSKDLATQDDIALVRSDIEKLELKFEASIERTKSELTCWTVTVGILQTITIVAVVIALVLTFVH